MSRRVLLRELAHARAGDKGDVSNVCVFAYDPRDYAVLVRTLTAERLRQVFPKLLRGAVRIYPLRELGGLNIVMEQALEGGVNASLNLDGHGKSWSFLLLALEVELREGEPDPAS